MIARAGGSLVAWPVAGETGRFAGRPMPAGRAGQGWLA